MPDGNESKPSQNKWAVMGGVALNVEYTRKYGFEATAAARVTAKLVAVPPPALFQEAVQADIVGRAKRAAALIPPAGPAPLPGSGPGGSTPPSSAPPPTSRSEGSTPAGGDGGFSTLSLLVKK